VGARVESTMVGRIMCVEHGAFQSGAPRVQASLKRQNLLCVMDLGSKADQKISIHAARCQKAMYVAGSVSR
jgi:hypothetical protein